MTEQETMDLHRKWQRALGELLSPVLAEADKPGLQVARVFYVVKDEDGEQTIGQIGITPEDRTETAYTLLASIITLLSDPNRNNRVELVEIPAKS